MKCSSYHITVCYASLTIFYNCRVFLSTVELSTIKITVVCFNDRDNMQDADDSGIHIKLLMILVTVVSVLAKIK